MAKASALSDDLSALAHWFEQIRSGAGEFTALGAATFSAALFRAVDRAERLEEIEGAAFALRQVRAAFAELPAEDNVLAFRPRPARHVPIGGGDAA